MSTDENESVKEIVDDSVITKNIKALLAKKGIPGALQISIITYNGIVDLSGIINSESAVNEVVGIVRAVKGVKSLVNHLEVASLH